MKPTAEQLDCVDKFNTGRALRVNAYAGTGKTSTLRLMGKSTRRRGTYLAFNKSIADEAKTQFTGNVACSTTHSLAFRSIVRRGFATDRMCGNINGSFVAVRLGLKDDMPASGVTLSARGRGYLICETVRRWMRSGRLELSRQDVCVEGALASLSAGELEPIAAGILEDAKRLWARMSDLAGDMPLTHDGYLKLWALSRPTIAGEFIFLDEAQDTNGVVLGVMNGQTAQVITVGDRWQQIYEWRGAQDAMTLLRAEHEARLSQSWRFGTAIAENASRYLSILGEHLPLRGNPDRPSIVGRVETPDAIVCRTNGKALEELTVVVEAGARPYLTGGPRELLSVLEAVEKLQSKRPTDHPDFLGFADWNDVVAAAGKPEGADVRRWVRIVETYSLKALRSALAGLADREQDADVTITTGHKSKGREWEAVRLADDFLIGVEETDTGVSLGDVSAEMRLLYVAATRGKSAVDISADTEKKAAIVEKALGRVRPVLEAAE